MEHLLILKMCNKNLRFRIVTRYQFLRLEFIDFLICEAYSITVLLICNINILVY